MNKKPNRNSSAGTTADSSTQPKLQRPAKLLPNPMLAAGITDDDIRYNLKDAEHWIEQARLSYFQHKDKAHYRKSLRFASKFINACR